MMRKINGDSEYEKAPRGTHSTRGFVLRESTDVEEASVAVCSGDGGVVAREIVEVEAHALCRSLPASSLQQVTGGALDKGEHGVVAAVVIDASDLVVALSRGDAQANHRGVRICGELAVQVGDELCGDCCGSLGSHGVLLEK